MLINTPKRAKLDKTFRVTFLHKFQKRLLKLKFIIKTNTQLLLLLSDMISVSVFPNVLVEKMIAKWASI